MVVPVAVIDVTSVDKASTLLAVVGGGGVMVVVVVAIVIVVVVDVWELVADVEVEVDADAVLSVVVVSRDVVGVALDVAMVVLEQVWQQTSHSVMVSSNCPLYPRVPSSGPNREMVSACKSLKDSVHVS